MSSRKDKGEKHCCHDPAVGSSLHQTLDEMDFERGLWSAALSGDIEKTDQLLSRTDCDVNALDTSSYTALHYAARNGHEEICKRLLRKGANVNAATRSGTTPLHRAAYCGHTSVVKLLLKHGAKPDLCDSDAQNALHKAAESGHVDVLALLLKSDPHQFLQNAKDVRQRTPQDCLPKNADQRLQQVFISGISST